MSGVIFLNYSAIFYTLLLLICFFGKNRTNSYEQKIYGKLIISSMLELIFGIIATYSIFLIKNVVLMNITSRIFLIIMIVWIYYFTCYTLNISKELKHTKKINLFLKVILYLSSLLILFLPLNFVEKNGYIYTEGSAVTVEYIVACIYITLCVLLSLKNRKSFSKKFIPIIIFFVLGVVCMILQILNPEMFLIVPLEVFVTSIMYHTIENPDVKMIEQLNIAKNQADKANKAKTDFLSSMSHEIRTPLNAIVGFSDCITQAETLEEAKENANDIVGASKTLLEIVNGILDISKIEAGKLEIHNSAYNVHEMLDSVVKLSKARLGDKDLDFRVDIAPDIPETLYGDHSNLKKVIINLLTNAIKYTDHGYFLFKVSCVNTNDICRLIISVEDSGRGIKEEDVAKLFTKFQRLDEDRNTTIEGTGLGLAITKQLVELMGGKIVVHSVYGEGSKFTVALDQKISETKIEKVVEKEEKLDLTGKRILIVDDNKLNLKVASKIISRYNPIIETSESGMECLEKVKNGYKYDIILMDDMMPRMSGPETLQRLKQIENFNIPVIALTANALTGMEEKYLNEGFDGYLAKPIEKDKLHNVLSKFLKDKSNIKVEEVNVKPETNQEQKTINDINTIDLTGKKILIVDDNKLNIKVATTFLKQYNPDIDQALSGFECIDKIKAGFKYDLILMDDMMPNKSGVETFHELEKISGFKTPVVALTANAIEGMREQYLSEGFDEYLSKPIDKKELNRILKLLFLKNESVNEVKADDNKVNEIIENIDTSNKSKFGDLPEYLFEINDKEAYKEKIETPKQFSSVYVTKDNKGNIEYLKNNGIDIDSSLELLGDIDTYNETLKDFLDNINDRIEKLKTFKESKDMNNYSIEVHALKSDSRYLGFKELSAKALEHEMKSKENDINYVINDFDNLMNSLNKVLDIVKKFVKF